jgi:hypothetical protein
MITIAQALKDAAKACEDVTFLNNYSGRGMYGRQCVGIAGSESDCLSVIATVIDRAHCSEDEFEEPWFTVLETMLLCQERDNMGRDVVIYWRQVEPIVP